jgi:hypothetical protein
MADLTLTTPVTYPSEAKYRIREFCTYARPNETPYCIISISVQSSADAEIRYINAVVPDPTHSGATVTGVYTALDTARSGESGTVLNRANFRVLGYLLDNGYFPAGTLNP